MTKIYSLVTRGYINNKTGTPLTNIKIGNPLITSKLSPYNFSEEVTYRHFEMNIVHLE